MTATATDNAADLARLGLNQATKALAAWEAAQEVAFEMAMQAIQAGADIDLTAYDALLTMDQQCSLRLAESARQS